MRIDKRLQRAVDELTTARECTRTIVQEHGALERQNSAFIVIAGVDARLGQAITRITEALDTLTTHGQGDLQC